MKNRVPSIDEFIFENNAKIIWSKLGELADKKTLLKINGNERKLVGTSSSDGKSKVILIHKDPNDNSTEPETDENGMTEKDALTLVTKGSVVTYANVKIEII